MKNYVLLGAMIVVLVLLLILSYMRRKKYSTEQEQMQNDVRKNDKIMTYSGIVGTVVDVFEEEGEKQLVIKTGHKNNYGFIQIDVKAVYGVVGKKADKAPANDKSEEKTESKSGEETAKVEIKEEVAPEAKEVKSDSKPKITKSTSKSTTKKTK